MKTQSEFQEAIRTTKQKIRPELLERIYCDMQIKIDALETESDILNAYVQKYYDQKEELKTKNEIIKFLLLFLFTITILLFLK